MISDRYDTGSARLMLAYLGRAYKRQQDRELARKKIRLEISKLKKISTASMRKYVQKLEHSIGNAIRKEKHILSKQREEDLEHSDISQRIREIEERLARYLQVHEERARRVKILESIYTTEQQAARESISAARKALAKAEKTLAQTGKTRKNTEQIALLKEQAGRLRRKTSELEKKYS
jgi:hypothetical protein